MTKTAFFEAIFNNSVVNVRLNFKEIYLNSKYNMKAPIHWASELGYYEIVKFLISKRCNIEARDNEKKRPIHWACQNNHENIVELLINNHCNLEAFDMNKLRPIHYACEQENIEILQLLIKKSNIEARDKKDWRPIHYAANKDNVNICKIFIDKKCNIEARDKWNKRPIHIASKNGNIKVLELLIKNGCNIESRDRWNKRAIHWSSEYGQLGILQLLLSNKCDIEAHDKNNQRAIHLASKFNQLEIIKMLIRHQCNIEVYDGFNKSPMDIAKSNGKNHDIIKELEEGITINHIIKIVNLKCLPLCDHQFCPKSLFDKRFHEGVLIGKGSFGEVHKFDLENSGKQFAVKYIKTQNLKKKYIEDNINEYREQLFHPRIIQYFGAIEVCENLCIFMEYLKQGSLHDRINETQLSRLEVIEYSKQILEGLCFLHKNHIIHRDIKPANILLVDENNLKLADFGLGRELSVNCFANSLVGTRQYMAPEIQLYQSYSFPADLWSVGITILEMSYNKFELLSNFNLAQIVNFVLFSSPMKIIVNKLLNNRPELRPTAEDILKDINSLLL